MAVYNRIISAAAIGLAMTIAGCSTGGGSVASWNHYGSTKLAAEKRPVALSVVDQSKSGPVIVEGTITEVCQEKGCWMNLVDGDQTARVKFKGYSFFVPRNAMGHRVVVEGFGQIVVQEVEFAKHLAEEAGKSRAEIDAITKPVKVYEIEATGVYIEGSGLDKPYSGG